MSTERPTPRKRLRFPAPRDTRPTARRVVLDREFSRYDRSLDMHISRIRRRLIDAGLGDVLQTQHGRGYLFA